MEDNLPKVLADFRGKGYVVAPAGYGKTHLIASAVQAADSRQLVLTTRVQISLVRPQCIEEKGALLLG